MAHGFRGVSITTLVRWGIPYALLAGLVVVLVRKASRPLDNYDTYFHLRFGREFLDGWSIADPGSVTSFATADWVPTQWLPQIAMALAEQELGLAAVAWLAGLQYLILVLTFFWIARQWSEALPASLVTIVATIGCVTGLSMRPQVLSYVLIAVTTHLWLAWPPRGRTPWLLIPLTWVWATYHGMWPIGIAIGLVATVASWVEGPRDERRYRTAAVPLLSVVAAGLTPVGPSLYSAVITVNSRSEYFAEWSPPRFTDPPPMAVLTLLLVTMTVMMRQRTAWPPLVMLVVSVGLAVYSNRTIPAAAAVLVPIAAASLQAMIARPSTGPRRPELLTWSGIGLCGLLVLALVVPGTAAQPPPQPGWVDTRLNALPKGSAVLNDWGWGGYLMWRYPHLDLVMHGYGDTFTDRELDRNVAIRNLEPGWDEQLRATGVQVAILKPDSPLGYALRHLPGWRVVEESEAVMLLVATNDWLRGPAGKPLTTSQ